jgi:carboxylesterase type B
MAQIFKLEKYFSSSEEGLPVMVWFHGGGYTSGDSSSRLYGPEYLLDKDVILVTSNYRLGIFGFLTLGNVQFLRLGGVYKRR